MDIVQKSAIDFIKCILTSEKVNISNKLDYMKLLDFSKKHGIEGIVYAGIKKMECDIPNNVKDFFDEEYDFAVMTEAMQELELDSIGSAFENNKIDFIPLKGSVVKNYYPMPEFRKSGDIDILIRESDKEKANAVMESIGYIRNKDFDKNEVHFSYNKPPCIEVEIHMRLVKKRNRTNKFCEKAWGNVIKNTSWEHKFDFNDEFQYVYLLSHLCKHLAGGGAGIRLITDLYVFKKTKELDEKKLNYFLKISRLTELNDVIEELIKKWFGTGYRKSENVETMEKIILSSGSFGNEQIHKLMLESDSQIGKVDRLIKRIFPGKNELKIWFPIFEGKNIPIVFMWMYRVYYSIRYKRNNINSNLIDEFKSEQKDESIGKIVKMIRN